MNAAAAAAEASELHTGHVTRSRVVNALRTACSTAAHQHRARRTRQRAGPALLTPQRRLTQRADVSTRRYKTATARTLLSGAMPPRRSARVAAVAEATAQRACAFPALPLAVELHIFSLIPADQRLRCAEVARGWRATVAQPALWSRVDLSPASGVAQPASAALLRAAVARAGGALTVLDVSGTDFELKEFYKALCKAAGTVKELHAPNEALAVNQLTQVLEAAPRLRELQTEIVCDLGEVCAVLEPSPFLAPLRMRKLILTVERQVEPLPPAIALALADGRLQPTLDLLGLTRIDLSTVGALDALAAIVSARRQHLHRLFLLECSFSAEAMPALARALSVGTVNDLAIGCPSPSGCFDAAGAVALGNVLRANTTLTTLSLWTDSSWAGPAITALLGALVGHRSLSMLGLGGREEDGSAAFGPALAALIAADAPALTCLDVCACNIGEAGLGPLFDALPSNTHLHMLRVMDWWLSAEFMRSRMLPAVQRTSSSVAAT